uniref:Uncharacterized protein n=1 Tax=Trichuris muris TaxID=70415 RepID=A0A5S6QC64_TRIMR
MHLAQALSACERDVPLGIVMIGCPSMQVTFAKVPAVSMGVPLTRTANSGLAQRRATRTCVGTGVPLLAGFPFFEYRHVELRLTVFAARRCFVEANDVVRYRNAYTASAEPTIRGIIAIPLTFPYSRHLGKRWSLEVGRWRVHTSARECTVWSKQEWRSFPCYRFSPTGTPPKLCRLPRWRQYDQAFGDQGGAIAFLPSPSKGPIGQTSRRVEQPTPFSPFSSGNLQVDSSNSLFAALNFDSCLDLLTIKAPQAGTVVLVPTGWASAARFAEQLTNAWRNVIFFRTATSHCGLIFPDRGLAAEQSRCFRLAAPVPLFERFPNGGESQRIGDQLRRTA